MAILSKRKIKNKVSSRSKKHFNKSRKSGLKTRKMKGGGEAPPKFKVEGPDFKYQLSSSSNPHPSQRPVSNIKPNNFLATITTQQKNSTATHSAQSTQSKKTSNIPTPTPNLSREFISNIAIQISKKRQIDPRVKSAYESAINPNYVKPNPAIMSAQVSQYQINSANKMKTAQRALYPNLTNAIVRERNKEYSIKRQAELAMEPNPQTNYIKSFAPK